tara:strand:- start:227 stop:415 length:189 start_codon:yes stop_codon:yes gene_type:complete
MDKIGIAGQLIAYENGEMEEPEVIALFQFLLDSGMIDHLQGSYQRMAQQLIDAGLVDPPEAI